VETGSASQCALKALDRQLQKSRDQVRHFVRLVTPIGERILTQLPDIVLAPTTHLVIIQNGARVFRAATNIFGSSASKIHRLERSHFPRPIAYKYHVVLAQLASSIITPTFNRPII
jgi:hypothetical protein